MFECLCVYFFRLLAVISGLSYFTGSASSDLINRHFSKNQIYALREAKEPGFIAKKALADAQRFISGLDIPQGEDNSLSEEQFKEYAKELGLD